MMCILWRTVGYRYKRDSSRQISPGNAIFIVYPTIVSTKHNIGTGLKLYSIITNSDLAINKSIILFIIFFPGQMAQLLNCCTFAFRFPTFQVDFHKIFFHTNLALTITNRTKIKIYSNRSSRFWVLARLTDSYTYIFIHIDYLHNLKKEMALQENTCR